MSRSPAASQQQYYHRNIKRVTSKPCPCHV